MSVNVKKIVASDHLTVYKVCLEHYRQNMINDLSEDDEQTSFHPEEAKKIHSFMIGALDALLRNPSLHPGEMTDLCPHIDSDVYEETEAFNLLLFLGNLYDTLFPERKEA